MKTESLSYDGMPLKLESHCGLIQSTADFEFNPNRTMTPDSFDEIQLITAEQGVGPAIAYMVGLYRAESQFPQLFEALKIQIRHDLGLPLRNSEKPDDLSTELQSKFEDRLLDACREVGTALFRQGKLEEGWMYLQPINDRDFLKDLLHEVESNDQNIDILIEIGLGQSIAPELGYQLILQHHGTCNSITVFDTQVVAQPKHVQSELAALLIEHVYLELGESISRHLKENEQTVSANDSVLNLIADRDWLFENGGHHLDVTHLASVVRIGRVCNQPGTIQQLFELCTYGKKLATDFHYAGQTPFEDTYDDHWTFYRGLLGHDPDECIQHFQTKAFEHPIEEVGTEPMEAFVDYLVRMGQRHKAIQVSCEHLVEAEGLRGIAPNLFEIAKTESENAVLMEFMRSTDDFLGYSMCLLNDFEPSDESE